jgi:hypothetical protein
MTIKYAYYNPLTGENFYATSKEELQNALATLAAEVFINHHCSGSAYTIVEVLENGAEKWYSPTGEERMTPAELAQHMKHIQSFINAGEIPVAMLGAGSAG